MAALIALGIAVLALAVSGAGAWAVAVWRRERRSADVLAARLQAEGRIEELTAQTLAAMREVARRYRRP
jgi:hypothetical protein